MEQAEKGCRRGIDSYIRHALYAATLSPLRPGFGAIRDQPCS